MSWIRDCTLNWLQYFAVQIIKSGQVPRHIAFIMDGNRRYANKVGVQKGEGHEKGFDKLAETLQWCVKFGVLEVTVYAFSIENFKRSKSEVDTLMELAGQKFQRLLEDREKLMEHGVCIRVIGNLSLIPEHIKKSIAEAMILTKDNKKAFLNIAFAYTSKDEITYAVKDAIQGVIDSDVLLEDVNENLISQCLYTYNSPDPDLLIRTSGEVRFSDFLMWQCTTTCVYFAEPLWPEFDLWDLVKAIFYYQRCYSHLQQLSNMQNAKCTVSTNNRISTFADKLHEQRLNYLKKICSS